MTRAKSRKDRGRATERLLAERWQGNGFAPNCYKVGAGESGNDILRVPGLAVEVKAKDTVSFPAALRQAVAGNRRTLGAVPIVVARHNGQGEASIGEWTVTMSLRDFEKLWRELRELAE